MLLEEKIMTLRKKKGWSQEELAFRLEVSRQSVSKWEMGTSVPELDKIIRMSEVFGCTTDYLLKEDEGVLGKNDESAICGRQVLDEECSEYLSLVRIHTKKLARGVAFCVFSPVIMFILFGLALSGTIAFSEELAGGIGSAVVVAICAMGVTRLIRSGLSLSKFEYLEKETIYVPEKTRVRIRSEYEGVERYLNKKIALGVGVCVFSVVPLLVMGALQKPDYVIMYTIAVLLSCVSYAVYLFVRHGSIRGAYQKLLQDGDYTPQKKKAKKKMGLIAGIYWCVIVAVFLAWSLSVNAWGISWVIWPVAGVLFGAISALVEFMANK